MSSGTMSDPLAGRNLTAAIGKKMGLDDGDTRVDRFGLSPRQRELNRLWCYYTTNQYSARRFDWDGREHLDELAREAIASATYVPPGFYDASGQTMPLKFRRPSSPFHIARSIVDRFTSLIFSEKRHPKVSIEADEKSEDFANAIADAGRLWPQMITARTLGGAMGTSVVGFQFIGGKPVFEVHDPRWVVPYFQDRLTLSLSAIEKRYVYPVEVRDDEGNWHEVPMWYRRVITEEYDCVYKPEPVREEEPTWRTGSIVEHKLGFCPVVWIQNIPVVGDVDGDPDCQGVYEMIESIDALYSSAQQAILANCDPTVVISTSAPLNEVRKGNDNAIKIPDGSASYMEINAGGIKAAQELAEIYESKVLKVVQVYLEGDASVPQTATEIERRYSSMLAKADILREQYGERGVKPLLQMAMRAAKKLTTPTRHNNTITRQKLHLPPRIRKEGGKVITEERVLGSAPESLNLAWPRYFEPGLADATQAVQAAAGAKTASLIDNETATKFIAEYFQIEDVGQLVSKIQGEAQKAQADLEQMALGGGM